MKIDLETILGKAHMLQRLPLPTARRALRIRAGLSQAELGATLGVNRAVVSRWERGLRGPSHKYITAYVAVLERLEKEFGTRRRVSKRKATVFDDCCAIG